MVPQPSGRGIALITVWLASACISTFVFGLRVYVRLRLIKRPVDYEDVIAGLGFLLFILLSGFTITGAFFGTAEHIGRLPPKDFEMAAMITWFYESAYVVTNMIIQQSISLMLLRYAVEDHHKKLIYVVTIALHSVSTILFFMIVFRCIPVSFFWTRLAGNTDGRCTDLNVSLIAAYVFFSVIVFYDVAMAILPWFMVRKLQLDFRTKLMVTGVLALGSIASIAVIVRIPFTVQLSKNKEYLRTSAVIFMISATELALSIIASSAATLKPLFRRRSHQNSSSNSGRAPVVAQVPSSLHYSSTPSTGVKECDVEFSKAFYGGGPDGLRTTAK